MSTKALWQNWLLRIDQKIKKKCCMEEGATNGCLIWQGAKKKSKRGPAYGVMSVNFPGHTKRKHVTVHRLAYMVAHPQARNEIMDIVGFEISHLCHNSLCVNPQHLSREPHSENNSRRRCQNSGECHGHGNYADCML